MTHTTPHTPLLVLIRGLPGSGKSYLANALQRTLGSERVVLLDPDATDYDSKTYLDFSAALSQEGVDAKFHPYRFLRAQAYDGIIAHKVIIWNQAFTNLDGFNKTVVNLEAFAASHDTTLPVLVVEIEVGHETAKARVAEREQRGGHGVNEEAFARFIQDYQSFAAEGYNVVTVQGEDAVEASASLVVTAIEKLLAR